MDTCHKLAKLFLGGVLGKPPSAPNGVKVVERCDGLEVRWASGAPTSRYNSDVYVVELAPRSPKVVEALGPAFSGFAEFHRGSETKFSFDKLGSEQEFAVRVRCENAAGASRWVEVSARTRQVPTKCGGTGPDGVYTWDQTPTEVEVTVPAPPDTTPRQVSVTVKPRRLEISFAGVVAVAGALGGEVVCGEDGDFEWELREREDGGGKELFITMEKRVRDVVSYDPAEQWDCLVAEDGQEREEEEPRRAGERRGGGGAPQAGEFRSFTGRITSVREGFCFMESKPGESNVYVPAQVPQTQALWLGNASAEYCGQCGSQA